MEIVEYRGLRTESCENLFKSDNKEIYNQKTKQRKDNKTIILMYIQTVKTY